MSEHTLCNNCKSKVKYIVSRTGITVKCNISPVTAYQESGRIVEVYLLHECGNDRSSNETSEITVKKRKLWVGPGDNLGRGDNPSK